MKIPQNFTLIRISHKRKGIRSDISYKRKSLLKQSVGFFLLEAERQGFEPRVPRSTTVFKTAAIDHSATSPKLL